MLFMNIGQIHFKGLLGKGDVAVSFSAIISYGASRFFPNKFSSPPAMPYNKFCSVPYETTTATATATQCAFVSEL